MKNLWKPIMVLLGFGLAFTASATDGLAQEKKKKKKKKNHGEACIGKGVCGKTKTGKSIEGQYRVW